VRGGFFSLFVFDGRAKRLLWWDGDAGLQAGASEDSPHGRPVGANDLDEGAWQRLAKGHVVGTPLADGRRVYVPLVTSAAEPQVWIAAYDRSTSEESGSAERGSPLALVPAWRTFLVSSLQVAQPNVQPAVSSANPRLALDADGRLLVQTDLGVVAALDARTGAIEWLVRLGEDDPPPAAPRMPRRVREDMGHYYTPTNDPPVVVPGRGSRPGVLVLASLEEKRWLGLSVEDGSVVWKSSFEGFANNNQESARVAALAPDVVALYGGVSISLVDGQTGKSLLATPAQLEAGAWPVGPLARAGSASFVVPLSSSRACTARYTVKRGPPQDRLADDRETIPVEATLAAGDSYPLRETDGPVGLVCLEGRLVAVTGATVNVYAWRKPSD
jgi:outer membrane protein assembly factor BamB